MAKKESKKKKKEAESPAEPVTGSVEDAEKKTIVMGAGDIESLVIHSVSELLDKGVLAESEDGKKIDLAKNIDYEKEKEKKKKKRKE